MLRIRILLTGFILSFALIAEGKPKTVYTSSIKEWTPQSLDSLIYQCEDGSTIVFDADYDYTVARCIRPEVSITIKGNGKKLRTINPYNYVISLFDVKDVKWFRVDNLIFDGSYSTSNPDKTMPKEFFITINGVGDVSFTNCTFQNIRTDYPNWKLGDEAYTIWVENYNTFTFTDNIVKNVHCPEFIKAILPFDNNDPKIIADISRNKMEFVSVSSAIEVRFGRFRINDNEIGVTQGSSVNAFGFDSELVGNVFHGSHNSSAIDLSEQFDFKYVSKNIIVKNNYSEYAHDGFLIGDHLIGISILNNVYRADLYDEVAHQRYDKNWFYVERSCDRSLILDGELADIKIISNKFIGSHALLMLNRIGTKRNIIIKRNEVENIEKPKRSCISLSQIDGLIIRKNHFNNAGRSLSYLAAPQFISIDPTLIEDGAQRYIKSVTITNNRFSFSNLDIKNAFIFAQTIYDKQNCNTLSKLENIVVRRNSSSFQGDLLLVSDDFSAQRQNTIRINGNQFHNGSVIGNDFETESIGPVQRNVDLQAHVIVEYQDEKYYVVLGGRTSPRNVSYSTDGFVKDGDAVLRKISY